MDQRGDYWGSKHGRYLSLASKHGMTVNSETSKQQSGIRRLGRLSEFASQAEGSAPSGVGPWLAHSPPQHQLGVLGHILLHKVVQECFEDVSEVLQLPMQRHREQRCHIGPVSGRESALDLQSVDELVGERKASVSLC